jgi:hypothetical protein
MLTRRTPLARGRGLTRRTRLRFNGTRSAARRARAHARAFGAPRPGDGDTRDAAIRRMTCLARGRAGHTCEGDVQAAHARARGWGSAKGDRFELVPLCARAHREAGEMPTAGRYHGSQRDAWELRHGVQLRATAKAIAERLTEEGYP